MSEVAFKDVTFKGKKLLRPIEEFSDSDRAYIEGKSKSRPDILLFPEEGKCVIVELKRPDVNLSDSIPQINKYAHIIYNYSAPEYKLNRFYVYLIGGELNAQVAQDIRAVDSAYCFAKRFNYLYQTRKVPSTTDAHDADMYVEIHSYATFLERAKARNKLFLDLLLKNPDDAPDEK